MNYPTHTYVECTLDLAQVEDMLYDKYMVSLSDTLEDPLIKKISSMAGVELQGTSPSTKAAAWADEVVKALCVPWKVRLVREIEIHLENKYENPYDLEGKWDHNGILSKMLHLSTQENWDMVISECLRGFKLMGSAFPIDLTEDKWLDLRIVEIPQQSH